MHGFGESSCLFGDLFLFVSWEGGKGIEFGAYQEGNCGLKYDIKSAKR
jgi:hypothetical protein